MPCLPLLPEAPLPTQEVYMPSLLGVLPDPLDSDSGREDLHLISALPLTHQVTST